MDAIRRRAQGVLMEHIVEAQGGHAAKLDLARKTLKALHQDMDKLAGSFSKDPGQESRIREAGWAADTLKRILKSLDSGLLARQVKDASG